MGNTKKQLLSIYCKLDTYSRISIINIHLFCFFFFTIQVSGIGNKSKKTLLHSLSGIFHCCLINSRFCLMFSILNLPTNIDICMRHVHLILSNSFCGLKLENEKKKLVGLYTFTFTYSIIFFFITYSLYHQFMHELRKMLVIKHIVLLTSIS